MKPEELSNIIATLIINGFHIHKIDRLSPKDLVINVRKYDILGAEVRYSLMFSEDNEETALTSSLQNFIREYDSYPIYINDHYTLKDISTYTRRKFFDFFGGIVNTGLILISDLPNILFKLGHNILPPSLSGDPDNLHELYVAECLQFLLGSPTRRYGQERSFEPLPDSVVLGKKFMILVDSKAYSKGYQFSADDIKRFASYVDDFNYRYSEHFGRVYKFLVVSGGFTDSENSITGRSDELYKLCGCKLSCLKSKNLGEIVQIMLDHPQERSSVDWRNILSNQHIETNLVNKELKRIQKDKIK